MPCEPSLSTTRTPSMKRREPSSLLVVKVVGPAWVMLIIPVQRAPFWVVGPPTKKGSVVVVFEKLMFGVVVGGLPDWSGKLTKSYWLPVLFVSGSAMNRTLRPLVAVEACGLTARVPPTRLSVPRLLRVAAATLPKAAVTPLMLVVKVPV